jgi:probable rRNA maturation factor
MLILAENRNRRCPVNVPLLKRLARRAVELEYEASAFWLSELHVTLVDDASIATVNEQFLHHRGPTDVISFLYPSENKDALPLGELIISSERARAQGKEWGNDVSTELALYVVHGILHLSGYDDATREEKARMRAREKELLSELSRELSVASLRAQPKKRGARQKRRR